MGKRAFVILLTLLLGLSGMMSPVYYAVAQETHDKGDKEEKRDKEDKGNKGDKEEDGGIGKELYKKVDEAVSGIDGKSVRKEIREALREMDKRGISPSEIARNLFGIGARPAETGKKQENALLEDTEKTIRKSTEKFFSAIWDGFLKTLGGLVETGLSVFSGKGGK